MKKVVAAVLIAATVAGSGLLTACGVGGGYYYSPGSKVYHTKSTCSGMLHPVSISYDDIISLGLRACKKCG